jgi:hypothetical protein
MAHAEHTIPIHPEAPTKVPIGVACNGCGVCCLFEPCPLGILLSHRRTGACVALRWDAGRYRCGALIATEEVVAQTLPRGTRRLAPVLAPLLHRLAGRWIAAGTGCDSSLEVDQPTKHETLDVPQTQGSTTMPFNDTSHTP